VSIKITALHNVTSARAYLVVAFDGLRIVDAGIYSEPSPTMRLRLRSAVFATAGVFRTTYDDSDDYSASRMDV
jgi:hypothetical protein